MRIQYRPAAIADIQSICDYITEKLKNPSAAQNLKTKLLYGISFFKDNPFMGEELRSRFDELDESIDYRYLLVGKLIAFYRVENEIVEIVRILDGRMDYISILFP